MQPVIHQILVQFIHARVFPEVKHEFWQCGVVKSYFVRENLTVRQCECSRNRGRLGKKLTLYERLNMVRKSKNRPKGLPKSIRFAFVEQIEI